MRPEPDAEHVDALPVAPVPVRPPASLVPADAAGLCFGAPIHEGGRIFVPVARVRADPAAGGLDATPLGVFDLGTGTARFRSIGDGTSTGPAARAAATAFAAAAGLAFGAGVLRRRRPARALSRPRWLRR